MKPRILSFIYTNGFRAEGDVGDALGILNTIKFELLPNRLSFFIVAIIQGVDSEITNRLKIEFHDVSQEKVLLVTENFEIPAFNEEVDNPLPKDAHILNFQLDLRNVLFVNQGWHKTQVYLNDEMIHEAFIFVSGKKIEKK